MTWTFPANQATGMTAMEVLAIEEAPISDSHTLVTVEWGARFAKTAAEDFVALSGKFPTMPARAGVQEHEGFAYLSEDAFLQYFANGVAREKAEVLYAAQEPPAASLFGERTSVAAWRSRPTWYAVSKLDQTISPDLERFMAQRMKATTVELDAGHLSLVSHAQEITELILAAAGR